MSEMVYDIKQAADRLGYTAQYIRMLIRDDLLEAEQIPISPGALVHKYVMTEAAIVTFETTVQSKSRRTDNRTKWVSYASFNEMEQVIKLLEDNGLQDVADTIKPWNTLKTMPDWLLERLNV